mmetsp:Transcript_4569/g.13125  ORF Transcript_4569/g.13125 Transcript_4569/m.13125 type:complete len:215 (-) Transcript_4569:134-778(-)
MHRIIVLWVGRGSCGRCTRRRHRQADGERGSTAGGASGQAAVPQNAASGSGEAAGVQGAGGSGRSCRVPAGSSSTAAGGARHCALRSACRGRYGGQLLRCGCQSTSHVSNATSPHAGAIAGGDMGALRRSAGAPASRLPNQCRRHLAPAAGLPACLQGPPSWVDRAGGAAHSAARRQRGQWGSAARFQPALDAPPRPHRPGGGAPGGPCSQAAV